MTFTPELSNVDQEQIILISNHDLSTFEATELSIAYNRARIAHGLRHLPKGSWKWTLFYDVLGQRLPTSHLDEVQQAFGPDVEVVFRGG